MELKIMRCPECGKELEFLTGEYISMFLVSKGEKVKLKLYRCANKDCDEYNHRFFKHLETGEAVGDLDIPLTEDKVCELEKY